MKRKPKPDPKPFAVPPATMAKLLEVAAMMLLVDALQIAARDGRTLIISFPKNGPPDHEFADDVAPRGAP